MSNNPRPTLAIGAQLENVPMGDIISGIALGIAEAQTQLDLNSLNTAIVMAGEADDDGKRAVVMVKGEEYSMMALGFAPTFYQFVDTLIEVRATFSVSRETEDTTNSTERAKGFSLKKSLKVTSNTINANYTSRYSFSGEASSFVRTKLVPVPPPAGLQELLRPAAPEPELGAPSVPDPGAT